MPTYSCPPPFAVVQNQNPEAIVRNTHHIYIQNTATSMYSEIWGRLEYTNYAAPFCPVTYTANDVERDRYRSISHIRMVQSLSICRGALLAFILLSTLGQASGNASSSSCTCTQAIWYVETSSSVQVKVN